MPIYPDKKNGKLTGRFRVEVQHKSIRLRARCDTLKEAKDREKEFRVLIKKPLGELIARGLVKSDITPRKDSRGRPTTILEALEKAKGQLWPESSSTLHLQAPKYVEECVRLLGKDLRLSEIQVDTLDDLPDLLMSSGVKGSRAKGTVNRHLSALLRILRWCHKRGYITAMPIIERQDEGDGRIRWLTLEEEQMLLSTLRNQLDADDVADLCVLGLETGMRRGEMLRLRPQDVEGRWAHIWITKNKTARSVPLSDRALDVLQRREPEDYFKNLRVSRIRHKFDQAKALMNLQDDPDFVFHALRHTRATRLVQQGTNLAVIQKLLGHKRITTTQRYAHVSDEALLRALVPTTHLD